jgi:hypothetical protein
LQPRRAIIAHHFIPNCGSEASATCFGWRALSHRRSFVLRLATHSRPRRRDAPTALAVAFAGRHVPVLPKVLAILKRAGVGNPPMKGDKLRRARKRATPLSYRTNRIIGGVAPSEYILKLERGNDTTPPIESQKLDGYLRTHLIDSSLLRADRFDDFMADRQRQLLSLIEQATGKVAYAGSYPEEGEDVEVDEDSPEAEYTIAAE